MIHLAIAIKQKYIKNPLFWQLRFKLIRLRTVIKFNCLEQAGYGNKKSRLCKWERIIKFYDSGKIMVHVMCLPTGIPWHSSSPYFSNQSLSVSPNLFSTSLTLPWSLFPFSLFLSSHSNFIDFFRTFSLFLSLACHPPYLIASPPSPRVSHCSFPKHIFNMACSPVGLHITVRLCQESCTS